MVWFVKIVNRGGAIAGCLNFVYTDHMSKEQQKQQFYKVFANLPINLREEIILVVPGKGPITWQVAFLEVDNDTELGIMILDKLSDLQII